MRINDRVNTPKGNGKIASAPIPSKTLNGVIWLYVLLDSGVLEVFDSIKVKPAEEEEPQQ